MLYYIKQHISELVITGDYEATSEGQSSHPEKLMSSDNSGDTIIPRENSIVEVKRIIFSWIFGFLTAIDRFPTNKTWLDVFCVIKIKSRQCQLVVAPFNNNTNNNNNNNIIILIIAYSVQINIRVWSNARYTSKRPKTINKMP